MKLVFFFFYLFPKNIQHHNNHMIRNVLIPFMLSVRQTCLVSLLGKNKTQFGVHHTNKHGITKKSRAARRLPSLHRFFILRIVKSLIYLSDFYAATLLPEHQVAPCSLGDGYDPPRNKTNKKRSTCLIVAKSLKIKKKCKASAASR